MSNSPSIYKGALAYLYLVTPLLAISMYFFPEFRAVLYLKDLAVVFIMAYAFWGIKNSSIFYKSFWFLVPIFIYLLISALFSLASLHAIFASLRQMLYPFAFVLIGYSAASTGFSQERADTFFYGLILVLVVLGVIMLCLPEHWFLIVDNYFNAKGNQLEISGYPSQWVEPIFTGIPRMVSTLFDPVNFGHLLVFALFILVVPKLPQKRIVVFFFVMALVLTFCKGAYLQAVIIWGMCYFPVEINRKWKIASLACIPFAVYILAQYHAGIRLHLEGIFEAIQTLSLFGYGIATAGNVASIFSPTVVVPIYDTFVGSLLGQIGLFGFLLWLGPWVLILRSLRKRFDVLLWLIIAQLIVSVYSENALNLLSIVIPMFYLGIAYFNSTNETT